MGGPSPTDDISPEARGVSMDDRAIGRDRRGIREAIEGDSRGITTFRDSAAFPKRALVHEPPRALRRGESPRIVHVGNVEPRSFDVEFDRLVERRHVIRSVFRANSVPEGFVIAPYSGGDQHIWRVTSPEPLYKVLRYLHHEFFYLLHPPSSGPTQQEFLLRNTPVGLTVGELLKWAPGAHEFAGHFIWIGAESVYMFPYMKYERLNQDIRWFLKQGLPLRDALRQTEWYAKQETNLWIFAFASAFASAGGISRKPSASLVDQLLETAPVAIGSYLGGKESVKNLNRSWDEEKAAEIEAWLETDAKALHAALAQLVADSKVGNRG